MTTADAILALFSHDDVVLRPSEIIRRTKRSLPSVHKTLTRLTGRNLLFRIGHCQYARTPAAKPIAAMKGDRLAALERRLDELTARVAAMEETHGR